MLKTILRSVWHYRRVHLVVMLAVAISTAVIGGSLIIGDSVRASLQQMTVQRLGGITHVLHSPRFFTQQLAADVARQYGSTSESPSSDATSPEIAPAMLLTGSVEYRDANELRRRASSVILLGVTSTTWSMLEHGPAAEPVDRGIVLGSRTAAELQVQAGDEVSVWIERPSSIPRDSLLGERDDVNLELVMTVQAVLNEADGASRFSLNPGQQLPYNAFISLETLQQRLDLQHMEASRRNPVARPARVNTVIAGFPMATLKSSAARSIAAESRERDLRRNTRLMNALKSSLTLADVGLIIRPVADRGYLSVESGSMILENALAADVMESADALGVTATPTLVYLANEFRRDATDTATDTATATADTADTTANTDTAGTEDMDKAYSMYSIIAGVPFDAPSPLGPFQLTDGSTAAAPGADEIVLSEWLAQDLRVQTGDFVRARWHEVGSHGDLPETHQRFRVSGVLAADDTVSIDQNLTPVVEGVTDVNSFGDWDQPFEMEMDRITSRDDDHWAERRATPKAFVSLQTAQDFWGSRFGEATSIRVASPGSPMEDDALEALGDRLQFEIIARLQPEQLGLMFQPVLAAGLQAAVGANDFSQLFLGFSFFLILSAILLASLMFRLGIQQRVAQVGLLEALGFTAFRARQFFLVEGTLVAAAGALSGSLIAIGFAQLMIYGLTHWWIGAIGTNSLLLDVQPARLLTAASVSLVLTVMVIWRSLIVCTRRPPRELLAGSAGDDVVTRKVGWKHNLSILARATAFVIAVGLPALLVAGRVPATEAFGGLSWRVVCFFLAGFAVLACGLMLLSGRLRRRTEDEIRGSRAAGLVRLAMANAARSPQRSLLTTALIACATFVIVAVGAGRRNPVQEVPDRNSGNGGFTLVAEASQPILFDLNTTEGRMKLNLGATPQSTLPADTTVFAFSMQPGQDASCLNLYQTTIPTLLGASPEFLQRGGFRFADTPGPNPWTRLQDDLPPIEMEVRNAGMSPEDLGQAASRPTGFTQQTARVPVIPVIGDMNTLQFSLKKGIGDLIAYPDAAAPTFALQVVGMLDSSVLQGVLVMTDQNLKRLAPDISGARYFLVETSPEPETIRHAAGALETGLNAFGVDTEPVSQRLAGFLTVQNTYLSTFQMLGGLGLLVGTFGLAAVMLRNVIERRGEIALLKAVGFTTLRVVNLILIENTVLLFWGIFTGTASALIAMLPHLMSTGADVPWLPLAITLGGVLAIGTLAVIFPVHAAVRTPIRETLAGS